MVVFAGLKNGNFTGCHVDGLYAPEWVKMSLLSV